MLFDKTNDLGIARGISPVATAADNTAVVSQILDMQGKHAATFVILTGSLPDADATFVTLVEESDASDLSGGNAVADADLLLTEASAGFAFGDDNEVRKIGYIGSKRYVRVTITPANNASASLLAGLWVFASNVAPVAQPT